MIIPMTTVQGFAQDKLITDNKSNTIEPGTIEHLSGIILPILFIAFLIYMLTLIVRYFLDSRLKNKLIDKGMAEQLSAYLLNKNDHDKKDEVIKLAILFCGVGIGLVLIYLNAPIHIHSLAIMAISIGLSYFVYFFYLQKKDK